MHHVGRVAPVVEGNLVARFVALLELGDEAHLARFRGDIREIYGRYMGELGDEAHLARRVGQARPG